LFVTGSIHQDTTHCLGCGRKEVATALPTLVFGTHKADIRFMDKSRRLQSLPRLLMGQLLSGQATQLFVDKRRNSSAARVSP
jgi:hypothetical protein